MTLMEFLVLLAVAGVCGALGQSLAGGTRQGCVVAIVLGFVGAWIGRTLAATLDLPPIFVVTVDGRAFPIVWAIVGSALLVAVLALLSRKRAP